MEYVIEKSIPIPMQRGAAVYPWAEMEVGDSILVTKASGRVAGRSWGIRHNAKFTSRATENGFRIWRTE